MLSRSRIRVLDANGAVRADAEQIRLQLVDMLWPLGAAFESVGVDSDRLFRHLKNGSHG